MENIYYTPVEIKALQSMLKLISVIDELNPKVYKNLYESMKKVLKNKKAVAMIRKLIKIFGKGSSQKHVREQTLLDCNLEFFIDIPSLQSFIKPNWRNIGKPTVPIDLFSKQDVVEFIKVHYTNKCTRTTYLTRYDNSKHRDPSVNVPEFTVLDLLNDEYFGKLKKHQYFKAIVSPLIVFIRENHYEAKYEEINNFLLKCNKELDHMKKIDIIKSSKKNEQSLVVTIDEIKNIFSEISENSPDVLVNGSYYGLDKRDTLQLGVISALYSVNGFRDDCGTLYVNPTKSIIDTEIFDETRDKWVFINYIDTISGVVSIKTHKTEKSYQITVQLPEKELDYIRKSLVTFPRKFLIVKKKGVNIAAGKIDKLVSRLFKAPLGRKITITDIRQSHVTADICDIDNPEEIINKCKRRGHDVNTATQFYKRDRSDAQKLNSRKWYKKQEEAANQICRIEDD